MLEQYSRFPLGKLNKYLTMSLTKWYIHQYHCYDIQWVVAFETGIVFNTAYLKLIVVAAANKDALIVFGDTDKTLQRKS